MNHSLPGVRFAGHGKGDNCEIHIIRRCIRWQHGGDGLGSSVSSVHAGGVGISAHAPHSNAGLLLVDFLISPEGQKLLTETFAYGSAAKEYGFEKWYPEKGLATAEYVDKTERWMKLLREIGHK